MHSIMHTNVENGLLFWDWRSVDSACEDELRQKEQEHQAGGILKWFEGWSCLAISVESRIAQHHSKQPPITNKGLPN